MRLVFMYGAGPDGLAAWPPSMAVEGGTFMERESDAIGDDPEMDSGRLIRAAESQPVHLVAVSYGAIAAVLAAQRAPSRVRSLTLFEPACADLARDASSVRSLRRAFEAVERLRNDPDISDLTFLDAFAAAMGATTPGDAHEARTAAKRLRASPLPWQIPIPRGELTVPTQVVTGGWSDFYEDIAHALTAEGADHLVLPGYDHAVLDHPEAAMKLAEFVSSN